VTEAEISSRNGNLKMKGEEYGWSLGGEGATRETVEDNGMVNRLEGLRQQKLEAFTMVANLPSNNDDIPRGVSLRRNEGKVTSDNRKKSSTYLIMNVNVSVGTFKE
jgi:hypothetical protein